MNQLLPEIIQRILLHLKPSERLQKALICRQWAGIVSRGAQLEDVWLELYGSDMDRAVGTLIRSQRQYRNLRIYRADLTKFDAEFWTEVGRHVCRLKLTKCSLTGEVFHKILGSCSQLRSLELKAVIDDWIDCSDLKPSENVSLSEVRECLKNVNELIIKKYLDEELLTHLLELMPNVTTLRADIGSHRDLASPFPGLLEKRRAFTTLDLSCMYFSDKEFIELLESCSGSLRELRLDQNDVELSEECFLAISRCSKLRCLSVRGSCRDLDDSLLKKIIWNAPQLESINVGYSRLTGASLVLLTRLEGLRSFTLASVEYFPEDAIRALGRITTLRSLTLISIESDTGWMTNLANLTKLRELTLWNYTKSLTPECFNTICANFSALELLWLRRCELLTDEEGKKLRLFTRLKTLRLEYAPGLTEVTFEGLGSLSVECLEVPQGNLTDKALIALATNHHNLRALDLRRSTRITGAGLMTLLRRQTHLRKLQLVGCESLTGEFLTELAGICPRLRYMSLSYTPADESGELESFRRRRPSVKYRLD